MSKDSTERGRPTDFKEEYIEQAFELALLGLTDKEIAKVWGVTDRTIDNWKKKYPDFFRSLTQGKDLADAKVARALYKRALGYDYEEVHKKRTFIKDENEDSVEAEIERTIVKHIPSDTAASSLWLSNRQRSKWSKTPEEERGDKDFSGNINITFTGKSNLPTSEEDIEDFTVNED